MLVLSKLKFNEQLGDNNKFKYFCNSTLNKGIILNE